MLRKSKTKPSDGEGLLSPAQTPGFESRPALGSLSPGNAAACRARARGPGAPWSPAFAFLPRPRARCRGGAPRSPGPPLAARLPWGLEPPQSQAACRDDCPLTLQKPVRPVPQVLARRLETLPLSRRGAGGHFLLLRRHRRPAECPQRGPLVTLTFLCRGFPWVPFPRVHGVVS